MANSVLVDGIRVNYAFTGQNRKRTIVFIHGWKSSLSIWKHIFNSELSNEFQLVALDLPGFGDSGKPYYFDYTIESYADILESFIRQLGIEPYAIVGHSLGGLIALRYAAEHNVEKLVLVGAPMNEHDAPLVRFYAKHKTLSKIGEKLFQIPGIEYLEFIARAVFNKPTIKLIQEHAKTAKNADVIASQKSAIGIVEVNEATFGEWVDETRAKILFIRGQKDKFALKSPSHRKIDALEITETGHCPMLEAPELFVSELAKFL